MILTNKQEEALKLAVQRYQLGEKYTCIAGYAGAGKTTLIKFIIAALGLDPELDVCYCAYTGKAATVLKQKGCANAITAHKLLYNAKPLPDGKYYFKPKQILDAPYKVIVVDEVSMLSDELWELLLSHPVYILACGDPAQLPPVGSTQGAQVLAHPHVFLDEILRQAQESEIIRLSMHIREGKPLSLFPCQNQEVQIFEKYEFTPAMCAWADQVLCATNATRNQLNAAMRLAKGFSGPPQIGDKIIGLHNEWDFFSQQGNPLTNGVIGTITQLETHHAIAPRWMEPSIIPTYKVDFVTEDNDTYSKVIIDQKAINEGTKLLTAQQEYYMRKDKRSDEPPFDFAYAYAITTWKAQGSQWDKVLVVEEGFPFSAEEHKKYLYTAATRAAEKLVIIKK